MADREARGAVAEACTRGITGLTEVSNWWVEHRDEVTSKSRWDYVAQRITGAIEDLRRGRDEAEGRTDASTKVRKRSNVA